MQQAALRAAADPGRWAVHSMEPTLSLAAVVAELRAGGVELPLEPARIDAYGDSPELSAALLALIREGRKRAGASLLWAVEAEDESLPQAGDVEVVVDHRGQPVFITRITQVRITPFN